MVFNGSRLAFHGSRWVSWAIYGSRLVIFVRGRFFMVLGGYFMVPGRFLWLFVVPCRCSKRYPFDLYLGLTIPLDLALWLSDVDDQACVLYHVYILAE